MNGLKRELSKKARLLGVTLDSKLTWKPHITRITRKTTSGGSRKFWWGGDLKNKTSKIRMSSPKLRVIFRPKSEIQTFYSPKFRWSPKKKKKKKVFTKIESDFSAEIGNSNVFFAQIQVVSKKKKKKVFTKIETDFSPDSLRLGRWGDASRNGAELFETEADFSAKIVTFRLVGGDASPL